MENKYCKASVTGFSLTMMSVLIGHFFIFNDVMIRVLGREVFDAVYIPLLISLFLLPVAGFVFAIIGLKKCIREKLKGKGLSIAAIVIFVVVLTVTILCFGLVLLIAIGEGSFHKH